MICESLSVVDKPWKLDWIALEVTLLTTACFVVDLFLQIYSHNFEVKPDSRKSRMDFTLANVESAIVQFYCSGGSPETNQWLTQAQVNNNKPFN
jgi:hypothetical protein